MAKTQSTGWEREHRTHFDDIVVNYDRVRWDYPAALFEDIFEYSSASKKALEIGAGTGKATVPFLQAGYTVTAVEMGEHMAAFLAEKFTGYKDFSIINRTFEDFELSDTVYDIVYAASAFHWVDAAIGCPKVFRLLKSGGTFALFRNNAKPDNPLAMDEEIQDQYDRYYYSYYHSYQRPRKKR